MEYFKTEIKAIQLKWIILNKKLVDVVLGEWWVLKIFNGELKVGELFMDERVLFFMGEWELMVLSGVMISLEGG